ncbi:MAG: isoleucine--tRNA ligase [Gemmatimonadetes bacterium]|nr:isoleucine--tRNA ligase [Gemmatimonadota bacterium]
MKYPEYPASPIQLEEEILQRWREEDLFRRTLEATAGGPEFVFYEGPPTANGRPGIHHVISRAIKDLVCRYQTMRGRHVTRIAGWDTHGLPVEIEAEKKLGISGKREIEAIGVARFNEVCRESVFTYKEDWERLSERIGYWLDYSRPYVTFAPEYIESVWSILKRLEQRGLIYRGHKSVAYCPRCGTALSSHEVAQGYEEVLDPSLYFLCPVLAAGGELDPEERALLVWTTTPWTLPSNAALAIHPHLTYAEVEVGDRRLILAADRVEAVLGERVSVRRRYRASELVGTRYRRPFDLIPAPRGSEDAWRVVAEEFVSAEDGTGIVHLAPAFGADDYAAGQRHGLPLLQPLDEAGRFAAALALVGGLFVKAADPLLVEDLEARQLVHRYSLEPHAYPHCWRCSSPLLYIARDSWYIRTTAAKEAMIANNAQVAWHPPEVGSGRFGEWLAGNVDWALSRDRYWGTPLPAWVCERDPEHIEFIGSFAELAERTGGLPEPFDPHKPWIDELAWPCRVCPGRMRRTPEVIDVWFDSGAMPYAQWHYPLENRELWRRHFPADFICEGVDQTRGWFYSLMAISSMLGDGPAYRNVVVNDLLLDAEGQKMSKSRGNVVDPWDAIAEFGADAIRWYLLTVSQPWVPKRFDPAALAESARRTFDTLANTYRFFALYANLEAWRPSDADPPQEQRAILDRWVLSRLAALVAQVGEDLDGYEITRAGRSIGEFIVEDLSNWYVRRSRDRFWGSADREDTRAAFRTLSEVLATLCRLLAPLVPFHADWLHRSLSGESVHLAPFPQSDGRARDPRLDETMLAARTLARLGRAARERVKIRVRQPLRTLFAVVPARLALDEDVLAIVRDELNVKEIRFLGAAAELVMLRAEPNFRALGRRFGARTPQVAERIRALPSERLQAFQAGVPLEITLDGEAIELARDDFAVRESARGGVVVERDAEFTIGLDPAVDEALRREGLARELVNRIQRLRREAGLQVSDRIRLGIFGDDVVVEATNAHRDYIARETLARELETGPRPSGRGFTTLSDVELDGAAARIGLAVV